MLPIIAGLLAGAGALYVAAEFSARDDEKKSGGTFVASELDINGIKSRLDSYFWFASKLYQRCNELSFKSCDMMTGSINLPDDDMVTKIGNKIYDTTLPMVRNVTLSQLKDINTDCHKLLKKYAGVFKKANDILKSNGKQTILIQKRHVDNSELVLDNTLKNDNWTDALNAKLDMVREFIEASYDAANDMIEALNALNSSPSSGYKGELNSICA